MSFSSEVKDELAREMPSRPCCLFAELAAVFLCQGSVRWDPSASSGPAVALGHPRVARKVYLLLRESGCQASLNIRKGRRLPKDKAYRVQVTQGGETLWRRLQDALPGGLESGEAPPSPCCRRAFLRGAFLCRGSLSAPEKTYHLEITLDRESAASSVGACLAGLGLEGRVSRRKGAHVVYLKESERIVEALKLMGAHSATLELENVRIVKGMRNRVNRLVNSETANVDKTITASLSQLEAIRLIDERIGLDALPETLSTLAKLRLSQPYASLRELGELLSPPVSKSGVNYRMNRLMRLAKDLMEKDAREQAIAGRRTILGS